MSSLAPTRSVGPVAAVAPRLAWLGLVRPGRFTAALLLLLVAAPALYLANTGGALTTGYNIQRLQLEQRTWQLRNQQLELELAKARSLAWVESEAVGRLGMQRPSQQTTVRVDVPRPVGGMAGAAVGGPVRAEPAPAGRLPDASIADAGTASGSPAGAAAWIDGIGAFLADLLLKR